MPLKRKGLCSNKIFFEMGAKKNIIAEEKFLGLSTLNWIQLNARNVCFLASWSMAIIINIIAVLLVKN